MQDIDIAKSHINAMGPELWARLQWDSDLWLVASGARMAEPTFPFHEAAPALSDDGDTCLGIAYRVPAIDVPAAISELLRSDRRNRASELQEVSVETPSGRVTAFAFGKFQLGAGQRKAA
ncbi:MAG TPA: hypothetical protein VL993_03915 [Stellaceae bacterium]|nr:hypothetical protein [Stellaceae bacterium]